MPEPRPAALRRSAPFSLLLAATLLAWPSLAAPTAAADPDWSERVPSPTRSGEVKGTGQASDIETTGRVVVRYREDTSAQARETARAAAGLRLVGSAALPNTELLAPSGVLATQAIRTLTDEPDVVYAEPEYVLKTMAGPVTEPYFSEQWALHNTGQEIMGFFGVPDVDMNVPEAWEVTTGDPSIAVAVLDTGVDFDHTDLHEREWVNPDEIGFDGIDNDGNGLIDDIHGWDFCNGDNTLHEGTNWHGSHVAGSIAAGGNGVGTAGVAPGVHIMAVKFIDDDNESCGATTVTAAAAIQYAYAEGARIINASWGGYAFSNLLYDAIASAEDALFVAAAGNDNLNNDETPLYPASFDLPNILSVASIHNEGHLTQSTNFGPTTVDLSAPGEDIYSTVTGFWAHASGTSMAAANTSGVAALVVSAKPELLGNAPALRQHLIATAKALPSTLGWVATPRLIDARAAVVSRPDIRRLSGQNRYETAAAISAATFTPFVPYLFVATGEDFPDALAGGALAAQVGSPLLLVQRNSIPAPTRAEIERLRPGAIFVLGGNGVVSDAVAAELGAYATTDRLWGPNRFATAAAVSAGFDPGVSNVFIATGENFPDALAGVPASGALGGPLLLATRNTIPPETNAELERLQPQRIVILGGNGVISDEVAGLLETNYSGSVVRMWGADRFATAADVSTRTFAASETAYIASGLNFPDALAGGPSGGAFGGPLLLSNTTSAPTPTTQELQRLQPARIFVLGGTGVVTDAVIDQINALFP